MVGGSARAGWDKQTDRQTRPRRKGAERKKEIEEEETEFAAAAAAAVKPARPEAIQGVESLEK